MSGYRPGGPLETECFYWQIQHCAISLGKLQLNLFNEIFQLILNLITIFLATWWLAHLLGHLGRTPRAGILLPTNSGPQTEAAAERAGGAVQGAPQGEVQVWPGQVQRAILWGRAERTAEEDEEKVGWSQRAERRRHSQHAHLFSGNSGAYSVNMWICSLKSTL